MKKALIILSILFIAIGAKAQGNLQFNQVKLVTTVQTVPANKVWKVENILPSAALTVSGFTSSSINFTLLVNGTAIYWLSSSNAGNNTGAGLVSSPVTQTIGQNPIWLPSGTTLAVGSNVNSISVIEFNIIP
jgi:hypothetical protein